MKVYLFVLFGLLNITSFSQSILDKKLDGTEKGKSLFGFLQEVEKNNQVQFYFLEDWINEIIIKESFEGSTLREALTSLFLGSDLNFIEASPYAVIIVKDPTLALQRNTIISVAKREQKKNP